MNFVKIISISSSNSGNCLGITIPKLFTTILNLSSKDKLKAELDIDTMTIKLTKETDHGEQTLSK